jgi:hypothetical protein
MINLSPSGEVVDRICLESEICLLNMRVLMNNYYRLSFQCLILRIIRCSDKLWMFDQFSMTGSRIALFSSVIIPTLLIMLCSFYSTSHAQLDSALKLPFIAEPFYLYLFGGDRNDDSKDESIANTNAITSCSNTDLTYGFASKNYLGEEKTSSNGKWKNVYSG